MLLLLPSVDAVRGDRSGAPLLLFLLQLLLSPLGAVGGVLLLQLLGATAGDGTHGFAVGRDPSKAACAVSAKITLLLLLLFPLLYLLSVAHLLGL